MAGALKNDIKPWIVKSWCVPPDADADYVWHMEDVIQTYLLPYDPRHPVVCFDEACKQLFGEVRPAQRARPCFLFFLAWFHDGLLVVVRFSATGEGIATAPWK